jgi:hypothetical protein
VKTLLTLLARIGLFEWLAGNDEPVDCCQACGIYGLRSEMLHASGGILIVCIDSTACRKRYTARRAA